MDETGCIFFDVEMRSVDKLPALVGVLIDDEFTITCLDERLRPVAEHSDLEVRDPYAFFEELILNAEEEDMAIVAYSEHEKTY